MICKYCTGNVRSAPYNRPSGLMALRGMSRRYRDIIDGFLLNKETMVTVRENEWGGAEYWGGASMWSLINCVRKGWGVCNKKQIKYCDLLCELPNYTRKQYFESVLKGTEHKLYDTEIKKCKGKIKLDKLTVILNRMNGEKPPQYFSELKLGVKHLTLVCNKDYGGGFSFVESVIGLQTLHLKIKGKMSFRDFPILPGVRVSVDFRGTVHAFRSIKKISDRIHTLNADIFQHDCYNEKCQGQCQHDNVIDVSMYGGVHALSIYADDYDLKGVADLGNVHILKLRNCWIDSARELKNVHSLYLNECRGCDASALGGVTNLVYRESRWDRRIRDVRELKNVTNLVLIGCHGVTDVSALESVHTLKLLKCHGVTDVSMLGNVHQLSLVECDGVTDVSMLDNVRTSNPQDLKLLRNCANMKIVFD